MLNMRFDFFWEDLETVFIGFAPIFANRLNWKSQYSGAKWREVGIVFQFIMRVRSFATASNKKRTE